MKYHYVWLFWSSATPHAQRGSSRSSAFPEKPPANRIDPTIRTID